MQIIVISNICIAEEISIIFNLYSKYSHIIHAIDNKIVVF